MAKAKKLEAEVVNLASTINEKNIKKLLRARELCREGEADQKESKSALRAALDGKEFGVVFGTKNCVAIEKGTPQRRLTEESVLSFIENLIKVKAVKGNAAKILDDLKVDCPVVKFAVTKNH